METQPELIELESDIKFGVLKCVISNIENNIKGVKPNNPATYVYQVKHIFSTNRQSYKSKFYEILKIIKEKESINSRVSSNFSQTDSLIFLLLEILNSNSQSNLNESNLKKSDYNETIFDEDLADDIKQIFYLILDHFKKVFKDKKCTPNTSANIIASSLINFEKDQRMTSNLVAVLERKITQKGMTNPVLTGGWGGFKCIFF